jgi:hypothetical protein
MRSQVCADQIFAFGLNLRLAHPGFPWKAIARNPRSNARFPILRLRAIRHHAPQIYRAQQKKLPLITNPFFITSSLCEFRH